MKKWGNYSAILKNLLNFPSPFPKGRGSFGEPLNSYKVGD